MRVLIVDDSVTFRVMLRNVLSGIPEVEVIGTACDGREALEKIQQLRPDAITLDLEMARMDGLGVLSELQKSQIKVPAIMLSGTTTRAADATVQALALGAFDFVPKTLGTTAESNQELLRHTLAERLQAIRNRAAVRSESRPVRSEFAIDRRPQPIEVVVIGISTGGPQALIEMLPKLPGDLPIPVLIVQHMPPLFTKSLADDLDRRCALRVGEAEDLEPVKSGRIYIAPGGRQMKIAITSDGQRIVRITDDPPEQSCRPAADYLFRSVAEVYAGRSLAVVMTGMGSDGTLGCKLLKRKGAVILAQSEESCVVYGMPKRLIDEGIAERAVPLAQLANEISVRTLQSRTAK